LCRDGRVAQDLPMGRQRVYYERNQPVEVITWWGPGGGPRNVLIERGDGTRVVRPFRGLRRAARRAPTEPAGLQIRLYL
jgi:hypothetical protein